MGQKNFLIAILVATLVTPSSFAQSGDVSATSTKPTSSRAATKISRKTQRGPQARGGSTDTILPAGSLAPATTPISPYGLPVGQVVPSMANPAANGLLPNASRVASTLPVTPQCVAGTAGCTAALPPIPPAQSQSSMGPMMAALAALAGVFGGGNKNKNNSNNNSNNNSSGGGGGSPTYTGSDNYSPNDDGNSNPSPSANSSETGSSRQIDNRTLKSHVLAADEKPVDNQPQTEPSTCEKPPAGDIPNWQKVSGQQSSMAEARKHCSTPVMSKVMTLSFFGHPLISRSTPIEAKPYLIRTNGKSTPIFSPAEGTVADVKEVDLGGAKDDCDAPARTPVANPNTPKNIQCVVTIRHEHCPNNDKISCVSQFRFNVLSGHAQGRKNSCLQFKKDDHVKACQVIAKIGDRYEGSKIFYSLTGSDGSDQAQQLSDRSPGLSTQLYGVKPGADLTTVGFK